MSRLVYRCGFEKLTTERTRGTRRPAGGRPGASPSPRHLGVGSMLRYDRPVLMPPHLTARHVATLVFIGSVLGAQLAAAWIHPKSLLWPFLQYDMYSGSARPGQEFQVRELRVLADGAPVRLQPGRINHFDLDPPASWQVPESDVVTFWDVRLAPYQFNQMLGRVVSAAVTSGADARQISALIHRWVSPRVHEIQIWEQGYRLDRDGLQQLDGEMRLVRSWQAHPGPGVRE